MLIVYERFFQRFVCDETFPARFFGWHVEQYPIGEEIMIADL
jgi:hypothetical protein